MKRVIIIQARMTSTRLPGKVLMDIAGCPMLEHQLRRLKSCTKVDEIVVATSTNSADDAIVNLAQRLGVGWFQGSEHNVLSRFIGAIRATGADVVVRVTGDCPLIDPSLTDKVVDELIAHAAECDYVSNTIQRTYPRGLDVEVFFSDTLFRVNRLATSDMAREHVTAFIYAERPDLFLIRSVSDSEDNSVQRWTVDTYADLEFTRKIYNDLNLKENVASYRQILNYVQAHPELSELNANVKTWDPSKPAQ